MLSAGLEGEGRLDGRDDRGNEEGVVEGVLGALLQGTLHELAAVGLNAGDRHLEAVQRARHLHLRLGGVLVGGELREDVHRLRLVDDAGVAGAAVHGDARHLALSCESRAEKNLVLKI